MFLRSSWVKNPTIWISLFIVLALCLKAALGGTFGQIGADNDDMMRLLQVRDLLGGQSWFNVDQTRMGPGEGTVMHWSRIADLPILILIGVFDLILPYSTAENLAISLWPPFSALLVIWGVLTGVQHVSGPAWPQARTFALVLLAFMLILQIRFAPGSIDHHNLQIGLLAISIGFALDPHLGFKSGVISGIALALSLAVGVEVYAFVAVICGFFALMFLWKGNELRAGLKGFGMAFAGTLALVFVATIAPKNYNLIYCDAFSLITLSAGVLGGGGLAILASIGSSKSMMWRFGGLVILGFLCGTLLWFQAPQCLANPLDELPSEVRSLWLGNVVEAQPLFFNREEWFFTPPFAIGTTCVALVVTVLSLKSGQVSSPSILLGALLTIALLLTFYQIRFYVFGSIFALFVLAPWVADIYTKEQGKTDEPSVGYILALGVSIPILWGFPAVFLKEDVPQPKPGEPTAAACYSDSVLQALTELPKGMVVATDNGTPHILMHTEHRVLAGNYHRNSAGIAAGIDIFTSEAADAKSQIAKTGAEYLHFCRSTQESIVFADYAPEGLMADLLKSNPPEYLEIIPPELEDGAVTLYRITLK